MTDIASNIIPASRPSGPSSQDDQLPAQRSTQLEAQAENAAFGFSLSQAVAALENRAAASLNAFGAGPNNNELTRLTAENTDTARTGPPTNTSAQQSYDEISTIERAPRQHTQQQVSPTSTATSTIQSQPIPSAVVEQAINTPTLIAPAPLTVAAISQQRASTQAPLTIAQANRGTQVTLANTITTPAKNQTASTPQTNVSDQFARLVANRLSNGDSRFEVRLDPPELGRIDVRLVAGEKNTLTLAFEQQSTLDLFRKDADALRSLLIDQGVEDHQDFQIIFEQASEETALSEQHLGSPNHRQDADQDYEQVSYLNLGNAVDTAQVESPASALPLLYDAALQTTRFLHPGNGSHPQIDIQV